MAEMQVGRDLDAAVARAIGGVPVDMARDHPGMVTWWRMPNHSLGALRHYSTSDDDAGAALDALLERHPDLAIELWHTAASTTWECEVMYDGMRHKGMGEGETRAAAICRAILELEADHAEAH